MSMVVSRTVAGLEAGVALAQAQGQLAHAAQHLGEVVERPRRHEHRLALGQHALARQVAHGQPVRVGGHQAQPVVLGRHQHAGEDRAGRRRPTPPARPARAPRASSPASRVTASPTGSGRRGNSSTGNTRRVNSERPAVMRACSPSTSTSTAPAGSDLTTSDTSRAAAPPTPSLAAARRPRSWPPRSSARGRGR